MNDFWTDKRFDRVVSVEMFEHMRNYGELFRRIDEWLLPDGRFFMHIFCPCLKIILFLDKVVTNCNVGLHFQVRLGSQE